MIYLLQDTCFPSIRRTPAEAREMLDLPWPVNPYRLTAVIQADNLELAFALTNTIGHDWFTNPEIVAHYADRSASVGDIFIDNNGHCHLTMSAGFMPIDRVIHLANRGPLFGGIHDPSAYRIVFSNR